MSEQERVPLPYEVIAEVYAKYRETDLEDISNRDYKAAMIAEQYTEAELRQAVVMRRQFDLHNQKLAEGDK